MRVDVTPLKDALRDSLLGLYCLSNREAFMIIQRGVGGTRCVDEAELFVVECHMPVFWEQ